MAEESVIQYKTDICTAKTVISSLCALLTKSGFWDLKYPSDQKEVGNKAILHTKISFDGSDTAYDFYLKLEMEEGKYNFLNATIGALYDDANDELLDSHSPKVRCAWYKDNGKIELQDWLPIKIWMNCGSEFANIIIQGDDAIDIPPNYDNFLTSFLIIGAVEGYKDEQNKPVSDTVGNFFISAGSDIMPERSTTFGLMTGNGNTDIIAVGTRSGVPYQGHFVKYDASSPFIRKNWIKESSWTSKYHVSPINVCHHVDRERGKWQGLLIGEKSGLNQTNLLTLKETEGNDQTWQFFNITAPYKFWNNGPNPTYGLFLRKE